MSDTQVKAFAERLVNLADAYKEDVAVVIEEAKAADLDASGIRRLAAWCRKDPIKRAEQEAIDEQYRFIAGETSLPGVLPAESETAKAVALYRNQASVRDVADALEISVGKAHKLRVIARAFIVHDEMNVNTPIAPAEEINPNPKPVSIMPRSDVWEEITSAWLAQKAAKEAERQAAIERRRAERAARDAENARIDADPLTIPPFLRRKVAA